MRVLLWHVHGSWTTSFVQGPHDYLVPVLPGRGPDGLGRARTWQWPESVVEFGPDELRDADVDVVIMQRPHEMQLVEEWTGRRPAVDVAAVYLEHNAPEPHPVNSSHPLADQTSIPLVHVTHFNQLFWDSGRARATVIEHGVVDPGELYTGTLPHAAVAINEPHRRGRMVGGDLLDEFAVAAPVDVFGMGSVRETDRINAIGNLPQDALHAALAERRLYLHTTRWTSLGLSLVEAMQLGMPIVAVAATEVVDAVPESAGVISTDIERLKHAVRDYVNDPEAARIAGKAARTYALSRYGLPRFLAEWDRLLEEVTS